jgi:hypothetical protein
MLQFLSEHAMPSSEAEAQTSSIKFPLSRGLTYLLGRVGPAVIANCSSIEFHLLELAAISVFI